MKVLLVTSEAAPFIKTGGLGDVCGALPKALQQKRVFTRVILPLYGSVMEQPGIREGLRFVKYVYVPLAWRSLYCGLFELKQDGVTYYFLDNEYYFKREEIYGHFDDGERFAFFCRAVVSLLPELGWTPDVIHCNDWQTGLVSVYIRRLYREDPFYSKIKLVFTIHNVEYQGRFGRSALEDVFGLPDTVFNEGTLEYNGGLSLMKGAIELSDAVTTVSPTYADEIKYAFYAHGMEGVIAAQNGKIRGILNGIDTEIYDPATDENLFAPYSASDMEGKRENKRQLQKFLGLLEEPDVPLVGIVSRLVSHKGLALVAEALDAMMDMDMQLVVLGRGEWHFEHMLTSAQSNFGGRLSANIMFNSSLAMKIYAGCDLFLMPSQKEPCGLAQMIAMRYGAVPLVRETGGLRDTVQAYNAETGEGDGFSFANYDAHDMLHVLGQALALYKDKTVWTQLTRRAMEKNFSWADSAAEYIRLYKSLKTD